jgi:GntR family transcriptional repressor for pyruvate dehydrogenase complex
MDDTNFVPIERQTAASEAIAQIRRLIASGTLQPGQQLPAERVLSTLLRVSRPTLREAIRALSFMGIVETRLGSGTYVSSTSSESLADALAFLVTMSREAQSDLIAVRLFLELGAAELAAREITGKQLDELTDALATARQSIRDPARFLEADIEFHRQVHQAAGNLILSRLLMSVSALGVERRAAADKILELRKTALVEHHEILDALRAHNPVEAHAAMRRHLESAALLLAGPHQVDRRRGPRSRAAPRPSEHRK